MYTVRDLGHSGVGPTGGPFEFPEAGWQALGRQMMIIIMHDLNAHTTIVSIGKMGTSVSKSASIPAGQTLLHHKSVLEISRLLGMSLHTRQSLKRMSYKYRPATSHAPAYRVIYCRSIDVVRLKEQDSQQL